MLLVGGVVMKRRDQHWGAQIAQHANVAMHIYHARENACLGIGMACSVLVSVVGVAIVLGCGVGVLMFCNFFVLFAILGSLF